MKKEYMELLRKRIETNQKKINRRKYFGLKQNIVNYEKEIFNTFHDEELLDTYLKKITQTQENFSDAYNSYLQDINRKISSLLLKAKDILNDTYKRSSRRVLDKEGNTIQAEETEEPLLTETITKEQETYYKNMSKQQSRSINRTIELELKKGTSYEEIAKKIKSRNKEMSSFQAKRIARTEIVKTSNIAQIDIMKKAGAKTYNFIHSNDDKVCPVCRKYQGPTGRERVYDVNRAGDSENPLPPVHPNCRCINVLRD